MLRLISRSKFPLATKIIASLLIGVILLLVFAPYAQLNYDVYQAKKFTSSGNSDWAYHYYQSAEKYWPVLKINLDFRYQEKQTYQKLVKDRQIKPLMLGFFKSSATEEQINTTIERVKSKPGVKTVKYVSSQEALNRYMQINVDNKQLLKLVSANILPSSFEVFSDDWNIGSELKISLEKEDYIDQIIISTDPTNLKKY